MDNNVFKKQARLKKRALFNLLDGAAKLLLFLSAASVLTTGFAAGALYSKVTAPRLTDLHNVTRLARVARLNSDLAKQQAMLARLSRIYDDKKDNKKSVYGLASVS